MRRRASASVLLDILESSANLLARPIVISKEFARMVSARVQLDGEETIAQLQSPSQMKRTICAQTTVHPMGFADQESVCVFLDGLEAIALNAQLALELISPALVEESAINLTENAFATPSTLEMIAVFPHQ